MFYFLYTLMKIKDCPYTRMMGSTEYVVVDLTTGKHIKWTIKGYIRETLEEYLLVNYYSYIDKITEYGFSSYNEFVENVSSDFIFYEMLKNDCWIEELTDDRGQANALLDIKADIKKLKEEDLEYFIRP